MAKKPNRPNNFYRLPQDGWHLESIQGRVYACREFKDVADADRACDRMRRLRIEDAEMIPLGEENIVFADAKSFQNITHIPVAPLTQDTFYMDTASPEGFEDDIAPKTADAQETAEDVAGNPVRPTPRKSILAWDDDWNHAWQPQWMDDQQYMCRQCDSPFEAQCLYDVLKKGLGVVADDQTLFRTDTWVVVNHEMLFLLKMAGLPGLDIPEVLDIQVDLSPKKQPKEQIRAKERLVQEFVQKTDMEHVAEIAQWN